MGYELVTLYDVARHAGVSIATVSRVLHGQDSVREDTRARVVSRTGSCPCSTRETVAIDTPARPATS